MTAQAATTRRRVVATIGIVWLAAIIVIAFQTWSSIERSDIVELDTVEQGPAPDPRPELREEATAEYLECIRLIPPVAARDLLTAQGQSEDIRYNSAKSFCRETRDASLTSIERVETSPPLPEVTRTVVGTEVSVDWSTAAVQAGLVTLVALVLAAATWVWTKPAVAVDPTGEGLTTDAAGASAEDGQVASIPTIRPETAVIAESLRQLKALHEEGILTDDEYETKRQGLSEKL